MKGGETNTVALKLAAPCAVDLAERLCGVANAKGGIVIIGVEDATRKIVGFPKAPALRAPEPQLPYQGETLWGEQQEVSPEIAVQDRRAEQVEKRLIQELSYVQDHGFITNGIYRQLTDVTDRMAHRDLERLVEREG